MLYYYLCRIIDEFTCLKFTRFYISVIFVVLAKCRLKSAKVMSSNTPMQPVFESLSIIHNRFIQ